MTPENRLRVVHVDDDPGALRQMKQLLESNENIDYAGGFETAEAALGFLQQETVDLLFLDVEMPGRNGLWLAEQLRSRQPDFAFVTAHAGYAAQAFEICALDYLLKPLDEDKLHVLLERVRHRRATGGQQMQEQVAAIYHYLDPDKRPNRIFINMVGKVAVVKLEDVLYFSATNNYTTVVLADNERLVSSKTIKVYEDALTHEPDFLRVSRSYIVNKNFVQSIQRDATTRRITLVMKNNDLVETSFKTKEEIMSLLTV